MQNKHNVLRHLLATLGYRFSMAVKNAEPGFWLFHPGNNAATPIQLVNHMNHLLLNTEAALINNEVTRVPKPEQEPHHVAVAEVFEALDRIDRKLLPTAEETTNHALIDALIQGPLSDFLTHVGQLNMIRRITGDPISATSYFTAPIIAGKFNYSND